MKILEFSPFFCAEKINFSQKIPKNEGRKKEMLRNT
jgi:hypothetical protein